MNQRILSCAPTTTGASAVKSSLCLLIVLLMTGCSALSGSHVMSSGRTGNPAPSLFRWQVKTALGYAQVSAQEEAGKTWLPYLAQAAVQVAKIWPHRQRTIPVRIFSSDADFDAAVSGLDGQDVAATDATGILIAPSADRVLKPQGKVNVLAHELTHWELAQFGSYHASLWVREGLAEWTAESGVHLAKTSLWPELARLRSGTLPNGPPDDAAFSANPALSYQTATAYISYLQQNAGTAIIHRLADVTNSSSDAVAQLVAKSMKPHAPSFPEWLASVLRG